MMDPQRDITTAAHLTPRQTGESPPNTPARCRLHQRTRRRRGRRSAGKLFYSFETAIIRAGPTSLQKVAHFNKV